MDGMHECEHRSFVESFYMAVVTLTTVGFGDITPRTAAGEAFFALASLAGVATYLNVVSEIVNLAGKTQHQHRIKKLEKAFIRAADISQDGRVDLFEFTRFVLLRCELVSNEVLEDIRRNFEELDADRSGYLSAEDVLQVVEHTSSHQKSPKLGHRNSDKSEPEHRLG